MFRHHLHQRTRTCSINSLCTKEKAEGTIVNSAKAFTFFKNLIDNSGLGGSITAGSPGISRGILRRIGRGRGMGLLSNRISRESLKPGDHIYSWRAAYIYAHHGIYVGDGKVIHFTRRGREVGTGTAIDLLLISSGPARSQDPCSFCAPEVEGHGVISSCLDCFLCGGILYRFEYGVSPPLFLAKARGGTCTLAGSDPDDVTVHRAKYLLANGFGCYNIFKNNCEDFAIYCKTGLLVVDQGTMGQSGQAAAIIGGPLAAVLATPLRLLTTNVYGMAATAVGVYCASRYAADIGMRRDVVKVSVEDLTRKLANDLFQVAEQQIIPICGRIAS